MEVLSPSTKRIDLTLKRSRFEAAGCASYWVVDPDEPAMTGWDLVNGTYAEVGHVTGMQTCRANLPFAVDIQPASLIAD